jgi:hypothetical protein
MEILDTLFIFTPLTKQKKNLENYARRNKMLSNLWMETNPTQTAFLYYRDGDNSTGGTWLVESPLDWVPQFVTNTKAQALEVMNAIETLSNYKEGN